MQDFWTGFFKGFVVSSEVIDFLETICPNVETLGLPTCRWFYLMADTKKTVTLFIQCLVDGIYPEVGEAMVKIFHKLGINLSCPSQQTCCGQPAFNAGYRREAAIAAKRFIEIFESADAIVYAHQGNRLRELLLDHGVEHQFIQQYRLRRRRRPDREDLAQGQGGLGRLVRAQPRR